jgi:hypothetical protein
MRFQCTRNLALGKRQVACLHSDLCPSTLRLTDQRLVPGFLRGGDGVMGYF